MCRSRHQPRLYIGVRCGLGVGYQHRQVGRRIEGIGASLDKKERAWGAPGNDIARLDLVEVNAIEYTRRRQRSGCEEIWQSGLLGDLALQDRGDVGIGAIGYDSFDGRVL